MSESGEEFDAAYWPDEPLPVPPASAPAATAEPDWSAWKSHLIVCADCTAGETCPDGRAILGPNHEHDDAPWLAYQRPAAPCCSSVSGGGYDCELTAGHDGPHRATFGEDEQGPIPDLVWSDSEPARPAAPSGEEAETPERLVTEFWHAVAEWERKNQRNNKHTRQELSAAYERAQAAYDAVESRLTAQAAALAALRTEREAVMRALGISFDDEDGTYAVLGKLAAVECATLAEAADAAATVPSAAWSRRNAVELAALRAREIKLHNLLSTVRDALGVMDAEYQAKVQEDIDAELAALAPHQITGDEHET